MSLGLIIALGAVGVVLYGWLVKRAIADRRALGAGDEPQTRPHRPLTTAKERGIRDREPVA